MCINTIAQEDQLKQMVKDFGEKTYLATPALGKAEPTVFEAGVLPTKYFTIYKNKLGVAARLKLVIRMLSSRSLPINTPSYMPDLTAYAILNQAKDSSVVYGTVTIGHHSNGQDHSFYTTSGDINLINGNFSTNYVSASLIKKTASKKNKTKNYYQVGIEQHLNVDRSVELNGRYGFTRLKTKFKSVSSLSRAFKKIKENNFVSLELDGDWILDKLTGTKSTDISKRLITSLTLTYKPAKIKDLSLFVQSYRGQDYYNIHFVNTLAFVRFGIAAEPSGLINALKS